MSRGDKFTNIFSFAQKSFWAEKHVKKCHKSSDLKHLVENLNNVKIQGQEKKKSSGKKCTIMQNVVINRLMKCVALKIIKAIIAVKISFLQKGFLYHTKQSRLHLKCVWFQRLCQVEFSFSLFRYFREFLLIIFNYLPNGFCCN